MTFNSEFIGLIYLDSYDWLSVRTGFPMAYYDKIAEKWHKVTGHAGGSFKKHVLNERILAKLPSLQGLNVLELGAGNGYFLPLVIRRFSGQMAARIVVTDVSEKMLEKAQKYFFIPDAEYLRLDVRSVFPFDNDSFDMILSTMVYNEVSTAGMKRSLDQCHRVLRNSGRFIVTVTHPAFIANVLKRGILKKENSGILTLPTTTGLRLPLFVRSHAEYDKLLSSHGFEFNCEDVFPTKAVLRDKPGLVKAGNVPIAVIYDCQKSAVVQQEHCVRSLSRSEPR